MSLLFFEGFETVGTEVGLANEATTRPRIALRFDAVHGGVLPHLYSFFLIDDRFGEGYAVQMGSNSLSLDNYLQWTIPSGKQGVGASATEFIVGVRVHIPSTSRTFPVFQVYNSYGSPPGGADFAVNVVNSADVSVSRFVGGTIETSTGVFSTDSWAYVEASFTISSGSSTNGSYDVYVDGSQELVSTAARTNGSSFTQVESIRFRSTGQSTTSGDYIGYDDIYILEVDTTAPNDFIGPRVQVVSHPPDGDGTTNWTQSGTGAHYLDINENGADSADYVETSTDTDEEMFDMGDSATNGEFIAVKVEAEAIAQTTTSHTLDVRLGSGTSVSETNHAVTSTTAYAVFEHYQVTDPNGGGAWTQTSIDAAQIGMQFNT